MLEWRGYESDVILMSQFIFSLRQIEASKGKNTSHDASLAQVEYWSLLKWHSSRFQSIIDDDGEWHKLPAKIFILTQKMMLFLLFASLSLSPAAYRLSIRALHCQCNTHRCVTNPKVQFSIWIMKTLRESIVPIPRSLDNEFEFGAHRIAPTRRETQWNRNEK